MTLHIEEIEVAEYEKVLYAEDLSVGLSCYIAIHSTALGPAVGGIRIFPYTSKEAALEDALRLSKMMTYKSALAECGFGGGKSVIILDPRLKTDALLKRFAEIVHSLGGKYFCAEDSGCSPQDVVTIREVTPYVLGLSGNPSPYTAWGTMRAMQAVMEYMDGSDSLEGKTIAIQGVGAVGGYLTELLFWQGAKLIVSDMHKERSLEMKRRFGAVEVSLDEITQVSCDILAPCAMGGVFHAKNIDLCKCRAIVGCANNQLLTPDDAYRLKKKGIVYAPDFVVNAGGVVNVQMEMDAVEYHPMRARANVDKIYKRLLSVFHIADTNGYTTDFAAIELAKHRLRYGIGKRVEAVSV